MHPTISIQVAADHRRHLEDVAASRRRIRRSRRTARTVVGLTLVRAGLRLSQPLTASMLIPNRGLSPDNGPVPDNVLLQHEGGAHSAC